MFQFTEEMASYSKSVQPPVASVFWRKKQNTTKKTMLTNTKKTEVETAKITELRCTGLLVSL